MSGAASRTIGNYRLHDKIGSGGMGSVHLGRFFAPGGFRRIVAIKRLHPQFAEDADFVSAFLDEARLASRVHHPNVVATLDVVANAGEVFLVFEHVLGVSLSTLVQRASQAGGGIPPRIAASLMVNVLHGLHAAHEAKGDDGESLGLVHRDVSPQNVLVGRDGSARLLDFGIAKATGRSQVTAEGIVKGKRGYMAPEHLRGAACRASDVYSAAVVLWEIVARERLFPDDTTLSERLVRFQAGPPSMRGGSASARASNDAPLIASLDAIAVRGLAHEPAERFATAREMAIALEQVGVATSREVGEWVERTAQEDLEERARLVERVESSLDSSTVGSEAPSTTAALDALTVPTRATALEAAEPGAPSRGRLRRGAWAVAMVAGAALLLLAVLLRRNVAAPTAEAPPPAGSSPGGEGAPPAATALPPPQAGAAASAPPPKTEPAEPARPHASTRPRPPLKKRTDVPCKPYVIDKSGRTQFNEDCLR